MSKSCECCNIPLSDDTLFERHIFMDNLTVILCKNCTYQFGNLKNRNNKQALKTAIDWAVTTIKSESSTENAKTALQIEHARAVNYIDSLIKCDICGSEINKISARTNEFKQCNYTLCLDCNIKFNSLKNGTGSTPIIADRQQWLLNNINNGTVDPEKQVYLNTLIEESRNRILYQETNRSPEPEQADKPWYIAAMPLLSMIMEFLGGGLIGGIAGFVIGDGILGAVFGALVGVWLCSSIGNISRIATRIEEQNKELSGKILLLYNEIRNKEDHTN